MPEHLRALVVILVLAGIVYALARRPACEWAIDPHDFVRRRNLWFGVTLIAFFAHDFSREYWPWTQAPPDVRGCCLPVTRPASSIR